MPDEIARGFAAGVFAAAKLYPAHATTNSAAGVTDIRQLDARLRAHGGDRHAAPPPWRGDRSRVDVFDREAVFIERVLAPLMRRCPRSRSCSSTSPRARRSLSSRRRPANLAATITAHHLVINRNALFAGGLRPHAYCLPVAKRESASPGAAPRRHLGQRRNSSSAPTRRRIPVHDKERDCGCAGIFSAPAALEIYAQVFEEEGALDRLEAFASLNGPRFYGLPVNPERVRLVREPWRVPHDIATGAGPVRPFLAGEELAWRLRGSLAGA